MVKAKQEQPTDANPDRLTVEQAAEILDVHPRTVYYLIGRGQLTPIKAVVGKGRGGRRVFFDRAQVEALRGASTGVK